MHKQTSAEHKGLTGRKQMKPNDYDWLAEEAEWVQVPLHTPRKGDLYITIAPVMLLGVALVFAWAASRR